jgi:hypothetical protein
VSSTWYRRGSPSRRLQHAEPAVEATQALAQNRLSFDAPVANIASITTSTTAPTNGV